MKKVFSALLLILSLLPATFAQTFLAQYDFSGTSLEQNQVTAIGAGFGEYPIADVSFGSLPTDHVFDGATDGQGMIIQAEPGEGVMILTSPIQTQHCALLRCSVRADAPHLTIYLASIDQGEDVFVSTITPNNPSSFVGRYNRVADVFLPPSTGFQGLVQFINTSETEPVTVYVDNFEILESPSDRLDFPVREMVRPDANPTPEPTDTPTQEPTPTVTPTPDGGGDVPQEITVNLPDLPANAKPLEMVYLEPGTFQMGSPASENHRDDDEGPVHQVTLTNGFYMGQYEVTQAQYEAVMGENPSHFDGINNPVEKVTWYDAAKFCNRLSEMEGLEPVYTESGDWEADMDANGFRLPTEAEWEYACRAGTTTAYYWGESASQIDDYAWYVDNSGNRTHEVGLKQPNAWGLFDISGNVWEWCNDWYDDNYYTNLNTQNPVGPNSGSFRVLRGGCWDNHSWLCRSASRNYWWPDYSYNHMGFRILFSRTN